MRKVLIFIVLTLSAAVFAEDSIPALAPDTLAADTLATDSSEISTIHTSRSFSEGDKNSKLSTLNYQKHQNHRFDFDIFDN